MARPKGTGEKYFFSACKCLERICLMHNIDMLVLRQRLTSKNRDISRIVAKEMNKNGFGVIIISDVIHKSEAKTRELVNE